MRRLLQSILVLIHILVLGYLRLAWRDLDLVLRVLTYERLLDMAQII